MAQPAVAAAAPLILNPGFLRYRVRAPRRRARSVSVGAGGSVAAAAPDAAATRVGV
jgi:hypothetical protein